MNGLWQLFIIFFKVGAFTFGGGYAMLPIIYHELCEKNNLVPETDMGEIVVLSQSLPGVMAVNCATQVGYRLYGKRGAVCAALGVVLPSYLIIVFLAGLLLRYSSNPHVSSAFFAIRAVVVGMILAAAVKLLKPCLQDKRQLALAVATVVVAIVTGLNPIFFIIIGGGLGWMLSAGKGGQA